MSCILFSYIVAAPRYIRIGQSLILRGEGFGLLGQIAKVPLKGSAASRIQTMEPIFKGHNNDCQKSYDSGDQEKHASPGKFLQSV